MDAGLSSAGLSGTVTSSKPGGDAVTSSSSLMLTCLAHHLNCTGAATGRKFKKSSGEGLVGEALQ
jgi:hypothetical protein